MYPNREPNQGQSSTRTYYRHAGVVVTDRWLVVQENRYLVADLSDLRTARGGWDRAVVLTGAVAVALTVLVAVVLPAAVAGPAAVAVAAVVVVAALCAPVAACRLRPRPFEMWAEYRGVTHLLFATGNATVYGQVRRAVIRAREASAPESDGTYRLAA